METLTQFRLMTVRFSLLLTVVAAAVALLWRRDVAQGIAMGGIAGVLVFWIMARRAEQLATQSPDKVHSLTLQWTFLRLVVYGLVLWRGYALDPESMAGLLAVAGGLMFTRVVMIFLAATGLDLKAGHNE